MFKKGKYTSKEEKFLKKNYPILGAKKCAETLNRSLSSIRTKVHKLKLKSNKTWTIQEDNYLKNNYKQKDTTILASDLNRTTSSIQYRLFVLSLVKYHHWTSLEIKFLKKYFKTKGAKYCSVKLNRSIQSIYHKACKLKIYNCRPWLKQDVKYLIQNFRNKTYQEISKELNRSILSIKYKLYKLNLKKLKVFNLKDFIKFAQKIHNYKYSYDKFIYNGTDEKSIIVCPRHGDFLQCASTHLKGAGCPKCRVSKGENKIIQYLDNKNIDYKYEFLIKNTKTFWKFDFYLPNLSLMIEYHGEQHYKPHSFNKDKSKTTKENNLIKRQQKDQEKRQYCLNNNIRLIEIPYWDFDKIPEIIDKELLHEKTI